ncbi:glycosyl hydrolase family 95 catalytic domain-containing protein [Evansella cellulosilytica]|uniref:Alpha-L-fucosidase n=1 Tax=Evansella cellulosilytica (strain ATCC 21833 / DSM 2522 / FERM P-1141 / JCM 9156 / N-4) TaxID=649639 RepID=E6TRT5_EVAC2|nr:glycoside hydrolase N-terminal domain-containing protein [Evansella cellulosilytica]ADU29458.1 Alpha-L-fucosidase [Evansella cellulosilytica DSM 2522]
MLDKTEYVTTPKSGMISSEAAVRWEEALVTGNGKMGALVYGQPLAETIILNHEKLYEPFHNEIVQNNDLAPYLSEIRELMKRGRFKDAAALFSDKSGHPLLFTDAYHPAYALKWTQPENGVIQDYMRTVNFETGEVSVRWKDEGGRHVRNVFISRAHDVIVQKIKCDDQLISGVMSIDDLVHEGSGTYTVTAEEPFLTFTCDYTMTKKGYAGCSFIVLKGETGNVLSNAEKLIVEAATEIVVFTKIVPIKNMEQDLHDKLAEVKEFLLSFAGEEYEHLLLKHKEIHGDLFNRMTLSICEDEVVNIPTEHLLANKEKELDKRLLQQMFHVGRYIFICASGDYPPNLVGLWTGDWRPPWSGDFTTDANVNLAVSGGGIGNMREALEGYFNLIEKISPDWRINAMTMYGCRGFLAGSRTDGNHNIHTHFNVDWPLGFWTAGAQWLVMPFFEWYEISGDKDFFINRALPLMKEIAAFYEDFLTEFDENGKCVFIPSYSPENTPIIAKGLLEKGWQPSQAAINATMDIAVAKELFTNLINTCEELNIEQENIKRWMKQLELLPDYLINEDGALKEWAHHDLHDQYDHRHISHLYPVWPGHEITPETTPELFKAAEIALKKRKHGNYSAHGVMHCGIVAARQKNSELVLENLTLLLQEGDYIHSSLVTSHNPGREIYNVDANCSLPTLVMEMLVYSSPGIIELLPALPSEIEKGTITGMLTRTEVTVKSLKWDLKMRKIRVMLHSRRHQHVDIIVREGIENVTCRQHELVTMKDIHLVTVAFEAEETLELDINLT